MPTNECPGTRPDDALQPAEEHVRHRDRGEEEEREVVAHRELDLEEAGAADEHRRRVERHEERDRHREALDEARSEAAPGAPGTCARRARRRGGASAARNTTKAMKMPTRMLSAVSQSRPIPKSAATPPNSTMADVEMNVEP